MFQDVSLLAWILLVHVTPEQLDDPNVLSTYQTTVFCLVALCLTHTCSVVKRFTGLEWKLLSDLLFIVDWAPYYMVFYSTT